MKIEFDPSLKDWGRDIHDLCVIVDDLKHAPGLVVESCLEQIGKAGMDLVKIFNAGANRMNRRDT